MNMVIYSIQFSKREQEIMDEIAFYTDINIRKRRFATWISYFSGSIMLVYTILSFVVKHYISSGIGILITILFLWIAFDKARTLQKGLTHFAHKKLKNKSIHQNIEYCFDEDGIKISSDLGHATNYWKAFQCWGVYKNYVYIRTSTNQMILVNQENLSEKDIRELKLLLHQHLDKEIMMS